MQEARGWQAVNVPGVSPFFWPQSPVKATEQAPPFPSSVGNIYPFDSLCVFIQK